MTNNYIGTLQQAIDCLSNMSQLHYVEVPSMHISSIGAHVRHITDHFEAIKNGFPRGLIDYEEKNRGSKVEFSLEAALDQFRELQSWLSTLAESELESDCLVQSDVGLGQIEIASAKSTLNRELMFSCSHAVHHYSVIKLMLIQLDGPEAAKHFGIAPSTANYLNSQNPQG